MCASRIIIEAQALPPVHPGEFLREEFQIGGELNLADVAHATGIDPDQLNDILAERASIDKAMVDLVAAQGSVDPAELERLSKALANATEGFAAARMNRGIAQALAGKNIATI